MYDSVSIEENQYDLDDLHKELSNCLTTDALNSTIVKMFCSAGLSVIPMAADGSKTPKIKWGGEHGRKLQWWELQRWFGSKGVRSGIAIQTGVQSGNLEVIDFDADAATNFEIWLCTVLNKPFGTLPVESLVEALGLPVVKTPKGYHVYYRCKNVDHNTKLAINQRREVMIESRGIGGYVITCGSPLSTHPRNVAYRLIGGNLLNVPTISVERKIEFFYAAEELNELIEEAPKPLQKLVRERCGDRPGDFYNYSASWDEILLPAGWTLLNVANNVAYWQRPYKFDDGISATTNYHNTDLLYVFSSNASPFEAGQSYSKFAAYTLINHDGDWVSATKELAGKRNELRQKLLESFYNGEVFNG